jgi:ribosomal protein S17
MKSNFQQLFIHLPKLQHKTRHSKITPNIKYQHPKYTKTLIKTKRYMAHDEKNECYSGDIVLIEESPPISRHKKWMLKEILKSDKKK